VNGREEKEQRRGYQLKGKSKIHWELSSQPAGVEKKEACRAVERKNSFGNSAAWIQEAKRTLELKQNEVEGKTFSGFKNTKESGIN
jgi:hypothetical protein